MKFMSVDKLNNVLLWGVDGEKNVKRLVRIFKNLKFAKQRVMRGYADCDVWNFDGYLYSIIKNGLLSLSEITISYPEKFKDVQSWKNELVRVANLVDDIDLDKKIDQYFDGDKFNMAEYYKLYAESEISKSELFSWVRQNINSLWD